METPTKFVLTSETIRQALEATTTNPLQEMIKAIEAHVVANPKGDLRITSSVFPNFQGRVLKVMYNWSYDEGRLYVIDDSKPNQGADWCVLQREHSIEEM